MPPAALAAALHKATLHTSLAASDVYWEAQGYSGAMAAETHGRLGARSAANSVPIGALETGLKSAGYIPHLLLRVPLYATTSLSGPIASSSNYKYFDDANLGSPASPGVQAVIRPTNVALFVGMLLLPLCIVLGSMLWTHIVIWRNTASKEALRQRLAPVLASAYMGPLLCPAAIVLLASTGPLKPLLDIWYGSNQARPILPLLAVSVVTALLPMIVFSRRTANLIGVKPKGEDWMSSEEKAIRSRAFGLQSVVHLIPMGLIVLLPLISSRRNPITPYLHPVTQIAVVVVAALVARLYSRKLSKFTEIETDHDLTWRLRQIGQAAGIRAKDVVRERGSRGDNVVLAYMLPNHNIAVTDKLVRTFTLDELDFVLARTLLGPTLGAPGNLRMVLFPITFLLIPLPIFFGLTATNNMAVVRQYLPWFMIAMLGGMSAAMIISVKTGNKGLRDRTFKIDRAALEAVRSLPAAEGALEKLEEGAEYAGTKMSTEASRLAALSQPSIALPTKAERIENLRQAAAEMGIPVVRGI